MTTNRHGNPWRGIFPCLCPPPVVFLSAHVPTKHRCLHVVTGIFFYISYTNRARSQIIAFMAMQSVHGFVVTVKMKHFNWGLNLSITGWEPFPSSCRSRLVCLPSGLPKKVEGGSAATGLLHNGQPGKESGGLWQWDRGRFTVMLWCVICPWLAFKWCSLCRTICRNRKWSCQPSS